MSSLLENGTLATDVRLQSLKWQTLIDDAMYVCYVTTQLRVIRKHNITVRTLVSCFNDLTAPSVTRAVASELFSVFGLKTARAFVQSVIPVRFELTKVRVEIRLPWTSGLRDRR